MRLLYSPLARFAAVSNITADISGDALDEFAKVGVSQGFVATEPDEGYVDTGILKSLEQR